jgi:hypothetical protein
MNRKVKVDNMNLNYLIDWTISKKLSNDLEQLYNDELIAIIKKMFDMVAKLEEK